MSDRQNQQDKENRRARELEKQHQQLMASSDSFDEGAFPAADPESDPEMIGPQRMLNVIERVRNRRGAAKETMADAAITKDEKAPASEWQTDETLPTHLGHFEIVRQLGRGGYGLVFLARDPELARLVALKIPRPEAVTTDELVDRFMREARAAAALSHPNIVPVFEAGRAGPICYIASEYVEGHSMEDWLEKSGPPSSTESAELVAALADGVAHAHQRGVLHRDLKPGNVLLSRNPSNVKGFQIADSLFSPLITDFGLAKLTEENHQTQTGAVLGTPAYMSPEQAQGGTAEIGPATDIYSLGAILYQLLTGQPPFHSGSILETLNAVQEKDPVPPRRQQPNIPRDLDAICLKCLEKKPSDRYASAMDLRRDLERFLADEPVSARPVTMIHRARKWCRRNQALAILSTAVAVLLLVALTATTVGWITTVSALDRATEANRQAELRLQDSYLAVNELLTAVAESPEIKLEGFQPLREKLLARANAFHKKFILERPDDPDLQWQYDEILFSLARVKSDLGDHQSAADMASELLEQLPDVDSSSDSELRQRVTLVSFLAGQYFQIADSDQRQHYATTAVKLARSSFGENQDNTKNRITLAKTLTELAFISSAVGERTRGNQLSLEAVGIWETIDQSVLGDIENTRLMARSYVATAKSLSGSEKNRIAKKYCQRAIEVLEPLNNDQKHVSPEDRYLLADAYRTMGFLHDKDYELAKVAFARAQTIADRLILDHPMIPRYQLRRIEVNNNFGLSHAINRQFDDAVILFNQNLADCKRLTARFPRYDRFRWMEGTTYSMLGYVYSQQKDFQKVHTVAIQARDLCKIQHEKRGTPATQLRLLMCEGNIADTLNRLDRFDEAIPILVSTNGSLLELIGNDPENGEAKRFVATKLQSLAYAYSETGKQDLALETFQESMQYTHLKTWELYGQEAIYLARVGQIDDARKRFNQYCQSELKPAKRALAASALIQATRDWLSDSDDENANLLIDQAAEQGVRALSAIEDQTKQKDLLKNSALEALQTTDEYKNWAADQNIDPILL